MSQQYVGIDLHRRRTVIVRLDEEGNQLGKVRIDNDPLALASAIADAGDRPEVVLEATYGWYWAADVLEANGASVHLAHPLGVKMFSYRRVKNDERDAKDLADLLRMGRLPEAWIPPQAVRELRELVRYRVKLVRLRSGLKAQIHAVLAKEGVNVPMTDLFGVAGTKMLDELKLGDAYAHRVRSSRDLIATINAEVAVLDKDIAAKVANDRGYRTIQQIPGVGPISAALFVAEIGDVSRFSSPNKLTCWAGLTPKHYESDTTVVRGSISKQGSRLVRWAAVEAAQKQRAGHWLKDDYRRISEKRNRRIAKVAVARKILTLVYWGMRDGEIRCLDKHAEEDAA